MNPPAQANSTNLADLPQDVLLEIYDNVHPESYIVLNPATFPWTLARVCRTWRSIIINHPLFWSKIRPRRADITDPRRREFLKTALERSSSCPLRLVLYLPLTVWSEADPPSENAPTSAPANWALDALQMFLAESYRWKTLSLTLPAPDMYKFLQLVTNVDILETISLESPRTDGSLPLPPFGPLNTLYTAPNLRSVRLDLDIEFHLPWAQLTGFHYTYGRAELFENLAGIPQKAPNLMQFVLVSTIAVQQMSPIRVSKTDRPFTHSNLKILAAESDAPLTILTAPNLKSLIISLKFYSANTIIHIQSFLQRSSCSDLTDIMISRTSMEDAIMILESTPAVCSMTVAVSTSAPLPSFGLLAAKHEILPHLRVADIALFSDAPHDAEDTSHTTDATGMAELILKFLSRRRVRKLEVRAENFNCTRRVISSTRGGPLAKLQTLKEESGINLRLVMCHTEYLK